MQHKLWGALQMLNYITLLFIFGFSLAASNVFASPAIETVNTLNASVLRVQVNLPNGKHGLGSAVVIAKNQVVTSCHVVNDATDVAVIVNGVAFPASAIKPDWRHDVCILTVENLNVPTVKLGATETVKYGDSIFTVGYPDKVTSPVNTYGEVKGLFSMDGSTVIRATSSFRLGASGGGAFNDEGSLIGLITVKSRGDEAYYYYVPVEWVSTLANKPSQALGLKSESPFWADAPKQRPYFMQVAHPTLKHDWKSLLSVTKAWVAGEPQSAESWFHLATAEYAMKDYAMAEAHFKKALSINSTHTEAISYLEKLTNQSSVSLVLNNNVALLN